MTRFTTHRDRNEMILSSSQPLVKVKFLLALKKISPIYRINKTTHGATVVHPQPRMRLGSLPANRNRPNTEAPPTFVWDPVSAFSSTYIVSSSSWNLARLIIISLAGREILNKWEFGNWIIQLSYYVNFYSF